MRDLLKSLLSITFASTMLLLSPEVDAQQYLDEFDPIDTTFEYDYQTELKVISYFQGPNLRKRIKLDSAGNLRKEELWLDSLSYMIEYAEEESRLPSQIKMKHYQDTTGFTFRFDAYGDIEYFMEGTDSVPNGNYRSYQGDLLEIGHYKNGYTQPAVLYLEGKIYAVFSPSPFNNKDLNVVAYECENGLMSYALTYVSDSSYYERVYRENGTLLSEGFIVNDVVVSTKSADESGYRMRFFDPKGKLLREEHYNNRGIRND